MAEFLEAIMVAALDAAVFSLLWYLAPHAEAHTVRARLTTIVFGIGFLLGLVSNVLAGGSRPVLILFALGFMLSYTAFLFTIPGKSEKR